MFVCVIISKKYTFLYRLTGHSLFLDIPNKEKKTDYSFGYDLFAFICFGYLCFMVVNHDLDIRELYVLSPLFGYCLVMGENNE